jgi:hypothetical protein
MSSFDNRMVPSLKAIKIIPAGSSNMEEDINEHRKTVYNSDFKNRGANICMAKAYSIIASKSLNQQSQIVK